MTTYRGATVDVLEALGLDPVDGPLIEWQTPGDTSSDPTVTYLGQTTAGHTNTVTQMALPPGVGAGDVLILVASQGFNSGYTPITCDDPRMTVLASVDSDTPGFHEHSITAVGFADGSGDPVTIAAHEPTGDLTLFLVGYRITNGSLGPSVTSWKGMLQSNADDGPWIPTLPAGAAPAAIMVGLGESNGGQIGGTDADGHWTKDAESDDDSGAQGHKVGYAFQAPGLLSAHILRGDGGEWARWIAAVFPVEGVSSSGWVTDEARSRSLVTYSTVYGRTDAVARVPPLQVTVKAAIPLADPPEIGDVFRLTLKASAADALGLTEDQAARFTGEVTDVQIDPESRIWTVIGVHKEAREARGSVNLIDTAAATLHDRVVTVLSRIGATAGTIDAGGQLVAAPDAVAAASAVLDLAGESAPGQVVTQLDGQVEWHGRDHRRGRAPVITLTAAEILSAITWAKHVGVIVNIATINYAGGSVVVTDHASVAARGAYPVTVSTALVARNDAVSLGTLIVGRRAVPAWDLPILQVDVARTIEPVHLSDLLKLRHSSRLTVTGLPAGGPVVGSSDWFAEGFTESAARFAWRLAISVTDPTLSGVSIRWLDVDPTLRWLDVDPVVRWLDVARIEDSEDLGLPVAAPIDGGDSTTNVFADTYDGGDSATSSFTDTLDGGPA